jgi:hypothetical protein
LFKQYKKMNDIFIYSIQNYEKCILYNYYYQIMTHEIYDGIVFLVKKVGRSFESLNALMRAY